MTPVVSDRDSGLLESLLNRSFPQAMSHTSVQRDSIFDSAMDSPASQTPVLRRTQISDRCFGREGPCSSCVGAYGGHGPLAYFLGSSYSFLAVSTV